MKMTDERGDSPRTGQVGQCSVHQLMVKNGVDIFFQGHDHLYAREVVDGIVYQEVPMPSDSTYIIGTRDNGAAYTDLKIDASGHVRVVVSPWLAAGVLPARRASMLDPVESLRAE